MLQQRFDQSQPGGNGEKGPMRIEALEKQGTLVITGETAQKVARWLEKQGHYIDTEQEDPDEEETKEEL